jgi:polar amino acid transport system substrate-binding protein
MQRRADHFKVAKPGLRLCLYFIALGFLSLFAGCREAASSKLIIGMELTYPPFEMTDEKGNPSGAGVEMAKSLGEYLGREIVIENLPFDGLIPALKTGKINLIISSMTKTDERAKSIDFSDPYANTGLALLVAKDSPIKGIDDLRKKKGAVIAVKKGTTSHIYVTEHLPEASLLVEDKEDTCVLEVIQGKADALMYDQLSVFGHWQRHQDTTRPLLKAFQNESWAVGLRKGDEELRKQVNAFLADFRAKGGFERLGEKYLPKEKELLKQMGEPFIL